MGSGELSSRGLELVYPTHSWQAPADGWCSGSPRAGSLREFAITRSGRRIPLTSAALKFCGHWHELGDLKTLNLKDEGRGRCDAS